MWLLLEKEIPSIIQKYIWDYKVHMLEHSDKTLWPKPITNIGQLPSSGTNVLAGISLQLQWLFTCPLYYNLFKDVDF